MQIIIDGKVVKVPSGGGTDFTVDPTLTMTDENVLSVTVPTKSATKEEYNALTDDEKKGLWVVTDETDTIVPSGGSNNVYSEEETVIGTCFGKPLYRKCYRPIEIPALSSAMWIAIGAAPVEANAIRKVEGSVISADGTETYMFSINPTANPQTRIRLLDDALTIQFYANSTFYGSDNEENYLAIEYTKSTD